MPCARVLVPVGFATKPAAAAESANPRARIVVSILLESAALSHAFRRAVLSVRVHSWPSKPVKKGHART